MGFVLRRAAVFVAIVLAFALLAAAVAHSAPRDIVPIAGFRPGTIVIKTHQRRLYYVIDDYHALRFPVGVGRAGKTWTGKSRVDGKFVEPAWSAPKEIRRDHPNLPKVIPGGSPHNPMGAAALTLRGGEYAIHGTNNPASIGGFVSYGCIRMYNSDIRKL
jgi:lipoprotein-anchoring transpeptidase ErfK/SrfK